MKKMTAQFLSVGQAVTGSYFGQPFEGIISAKTFGGPYSCSYHVDLAHPINDGRDAICVLQDTRDDLQEITENHWIEPKGEL